MELGGLSKLKDLPAGPPLTKREQREQRGRGHHHHQPHRNHQRHRQEQPDEPLGKILIVTRTGQLMSTAELLCTRREGRLTIHDAVVPLQLDRDWARLNGKIASFERNGQYPLSALEPEGTELVIVRVYRQPSGAWFRTYDANEGVDGDLSGSLPYIEKAPVDCLERLSKFTGMEWRIDQAIKYAQYLAVPHGAFVKMYELMAHDLEQMPEEDRDIHAQILNVIGNMSGYDPTAGTETEAGDEEAITDDTPVVESEEHAMALLDGTPPIPKRSSCSL